MKDLAALNDEIAALVRAGMPLDEGLRSLGSGRSPRLDRLNRALTDRMRQGESLSDALEAEADQVPAVYRAVVEAGMKSNRLPQALESLADFAQSLMEVRWRITLAMFYPAVVVMLAYGLFVFFILVMIPQFASTLTMFGIEPGGSLRFFAGLSDSVSAWGPIFPAFFVLLMAWWLLSSGSASIVGQSPGGQALFWIPGMRQIVRNFHRANFAELLGILLDHDVALPDALTLAAEATGDAETITAAEFLADDVTAGGDLTASVQQVASFPPFMRWMIGSGARDGALPAALRQVTEIYRRRAQFQAEWVKMFVPLAIVLVVGGTAVLSYSLTLFLPLSGLLKALSTPTI